MKKLFLSLAVYFLILGSILNAGEGGYSYSHFIGFSKDGRYVAYSQSVSMSEMYQKVTCIDLNRNEIVWEKENKDKAKLEDTRAKLKAQGIIEGNVGTRVINHPLTDMEAKSESAKFYRVAFPSTHLDPFSLNTQTFEAEGTGCDWENDPEEARRPRLLELKLTNLQNKSSRIIFKDKVLPKNRDCAFSYRIQDVYVYEVIPSSGNESKNKVAVILNAFSPSVEGPDMQFIAVGGELW